MANKYVNSADLAKRLSSGKGLDDQINLMEILAAIIDMDESLRIGTLEKAASSLKELPNQVKRLAGKRTSAPVEQIVQQASSPPSASSTQTPSEWIEPVPQQTQPPVEETVFPPRPEQQMTQVGSESITYNGAPASYAGSGLRPSGNGASDMRSALQMQQMRDERARAAMLDRMIKSGDPNLQAQAQALFAADSARDQQRLQEQALQNERQIGLMEAEAKQTEAEASKAYYESQARKADAALKDAINSAKGDPNALKANLLKLFAGPEGNMFLGYLRDAGIDTKDLLMKLFLSSGIELKKLVGGSDENKSDVSGNPDAAFFG